MHKEEFYSTLLEDEFISFLIKQIKAKARENKMEQYLNLIENLDYDNFTNSNKNYNSTCISNNKNNPTNTCNQNFSKEMTRFSLFLDNQLREIIEQQNLLERQFQSIKANNNINNLNNLNNLINLKNNAANFYLNNNNNFSLNNNNECACFNRENQTSGANNINISNLSNNLINECSHSHVQNDSNFSTHYTTSNLNTHNNVNFNYINNPNSQFGHKTNIKNQTCCTSNTNFKILNSCNKINVTCNTCNSNNNSTNASVISVSEKMHGFNSSNNSNGSGNKTDTNNSNCLNNISSAINKNDKFTDIDALVAYINTTDDTKTKKNKKKGAKKKNQQQKNLKIVNNSGINDELVVENFRKNIYKDSCYAENIRKIKPIFSMEWLKSINNIVK